MILKSFLEVVTSNVIIYNVCDEEFKIEGHPSNILFENKFNNELLSSEIHEVYSLENQCIVIRIISK